MMKLVMFAIAISKLPFRIFSKVSPLALIRNSKIDDSSAIGRGCRIYDSEVKKYSFVGKNSIVCNTTVGKFSSISFDCVINPGEHPLNMVSTSPVFYSKNNVLKKSFNYVPFKEFEKVQIGNDVWIGTRVFINKGITIGNGAVIGAYSVVTKNVDPYTIVAGNPARVIKKRFEDHIITSLEAEKWWDWDEKKLEGNASKFSDPKFLNDHS